MGKETLNPKKFGLTIVTIKDQFRCLNLNDYRIAGGKPLRAAIGSMFFATLAALESENQTNPPSSPPMITVRLFICARCLG
jgi:hypothetical protein